MEGARARGTWTAVHLLSAYEVKSLFQDVVQGLAFLVRYHQLLSDSWLTLLFPWVSQHNKSILHLDLKPGNVLLTWDEGKLMYVNRFLPHLGHLFTSIYLPQTQSNVVRLWNIARYDAQFP